MRHVSALPSRVINLLSWRAALERRTFGIAQGALRPGLRVDRHVDRLCRGECYNPSDERHLITSVEFLRGLTLAQITPGPLIILATYLGFVTSGIIGAVTTTVATFLPAFVFGIYVLPRVESKILKSAKLQLFFSWLMPAVCGAIFGSLIRLMLLSVQNEGQLVYPRLFIIIALFALQLKYQDGK